MTSKISVPFPDEPGAVYMTEGEWGKFLMKLGETCAWYWCEKAEIYAEEQPRKWAKYKNHYRTLLNWHQMKVENGYEFLDHPQHGPGYYRAWLVEKVRAQS